MDSTALISCMNAQGLVETEQPKGKQHEEYSSPNSLIFLPLSHTASYKMTEKRLSDLEECDHLKINFNSQI